MVSIFPFTWIFGALLLVLFMNRRHSLIITLFGQIFVLHTTLPMINILCYEFLLTINFFSFPLHLVNIFCKIKIHAGKNANHIWMCDLWKKQRWYYAKLSGVSNTTIKMLKFNSLLNTPQKWPN